MDYESPTESRKYSIIIDVKDVSPLTTSHETSLGWHTGFVKNPFIGNEVAEIFVRGTICHQSLPAVSIKEAGYLITSAHVSESKMSLQPTLCRTGKTAVGEKRRAEMWLPSFSALGIDSLILPGNPHHCNKQQEVGKDPLMTAVQADVRQHSSDLCSEKLGIYPLPTPPEDVPFTWEFEHRSRIAIESLAASSHQAASTSHRVSHSTADESTSHRPPSIPLPPYGDMNENGGLPSTWLDRAIGNLFAVSSRDDILRERQLTMVVQASPSQAKFPLAKPVFQQVVEAVQQQSADAPYILITHAVSEVVSMEEIPASPPATPNTLNTSENYFQDQSIFTHAAVIPSYHTPASVAAHAKRANGINAPASVHVSTLERYIPPTTAEEVEDFFSTHRSYLVDRLTELSPNNGTLLLIYPTAAGARTFAHNYIGPIIEPFLRQFCLLNNLTSDAATRLGKVAALSAMKDFGAMTNALQDLCSSLMERAPADREPRSGYHVIHAESASIPIERRTWIEWFVEQEAMRLKQDMIDYQKAGGRMPARDFGNTPGSLAREVINGIRNSKENTGGLIEVGVYVIRRSMI